LEAEEFEDESSDESRDAVKARERLVTEVPVFDEEKTRELIPEMMEEYRGHWLEEDEAKQQELV